MYCIKNDKFIIFFQLFYRSSIYGIIIIMFRMASQDCVLRYDNDFFKNYEFSNLIIIRIVT